LQTLNVHRPDAQSELKVQAIPLSNALPPPDAALHTPKVQRPDWQSSLILHVCPAGGQ
jgi:hypothetical protein